MSAPVVRTEDGAILGPDWRRVPGMSDYPVPGMVPAEFVMPGDVVAFGEQAVTVLRVLPVANSWTVELITRTQSGCEIATQKRRDERVQVLAVGAFDR